MSRRYVSTQCSIYTDPDLAGWHPLTIYFYRYLYENDHANGLTGIGDIPLRVMRAEAKLTRTQIERAKEQMGDKVHWFSDTCYWVKGRINHTSYTDTGKLHPKQGRGAVLVLNGLSAEIRLEVGQKYPDLAAIGLAIDRRPVVEPPVTGVAVVVVRNSSSSRNRENDNDTVNDTVISADAETTPPFAPDAPKWEEEVKSVWNELAATWKLPTLRSLTAKRKRVLAARKRESGWWADWRRALAEIPKSAFLLGDNDRQWRANFDWFIRPGSILRFLEQGLWQAEGKTDNRERYGDELDRRR